MMLGTLLSLTAGILLGLFQLTHRRASEDLSDSPLRLAILLAIAFVTISLVVLLSDARAYIGELPLLSIVSFSVSGLIHFFLGFHLMSLSQSKVGVGRTGVLIGATPVFSALIGFVAFGERLSPVILTGIGVVIAGVVMVSLSRVSSATPVHKKYFLFGLGAALCYATSPVLVRIGLRNFNFPTIGVAVGMAAALLTSVLLLLIRGKGSKPTFSPQSLRRGAVIAGLAGILIGIATWVRYVALTLSPLAVVTTMSRVSIPLVLLLSPLVLVSNTEKHSVQTWLGAGLIVAGSVVIGFS